jgi:hypothetical protein
MATTLEKLRAKARSVSKRLRRRGDILLTKKEKAALAKVGRESAGKPAQDVEAEARKAVQYGIRSDAEGAALDFREKYAKEIKEDPELVDLFWQHVRLTAEDDT